MRGLLNVINQSGDLCSAEINVSILNAQNLKSHTWEGFEALLLSEAVTGFRADILKTINEILPPYKRVGQTELKQFLAMARHFRIKEAQQILRLATGSHPAQGFAFVYARFQQLGVFWNLQNACGGVLLLLCVRICLLGECGAVGRYENSRSRESYYFLNSQVLGSEDGI
jgi:hypothetical protein